MRFGAAVWPFQWDPPYDKAVEHIASLGFEAVELIIWDNESFDYYSAVETAKLRRLLDNAGLELSQLVHSPRGLASPEEGIRRRAVESFGRAVDVGVALGAKLMNSVGALPLETPTPHMVDRPQMQQFEVSYPRGADWHRNWEVYVDSVRQCTSISVDAGMSYTIEPIPYRWVSNAASMLRLIEHVGSQHLGMNFDPSHLFAVGEIPHVVVYELGDRIFHCDFSDNDGVTNAHWRPGKGKIDWRAVFDALIDVGYEGVISMELEDAPGAARGAKARRSAGGNQRPTASSQFSSETVAGVQYIHRIAREKGADISWPR